MQKRRYVRALIARGEIAGGRPAGRYSASVRMSAATCPFGEST